MRRRKHGSDHDPSETVFRTQQACHCEHKYDLDKFRSLEAESADINRQLRTVRHICSDKDQSKKPDTDKHITPGHFRKDKQLPDDQRNKQ